MRIFISHQQADSALALRLSKRLREIHLIDTHLDVIEPERPGHGETLAHLIRKRLGASTHLLAVVSEATKLSWWVPWEIGVASEKDYPLATYPGGNAELPDYLKIWPFLVNDRDLGQYAAACRVEDASTALESYRHTPAVRQRSTGEFYRALRQRLGQ